VRRFLVIPLVLALLSQAVVAADKDEPKKVADTRKKLEEKISVKWKETPLRNVMEDLFEDETRGKIPWKSDRNAVVLNTKITYEAKDKPVSEVLNDLCKKYDLGWYVITKPDPQYQGGVYLEKSMARGYAEGQTPPDKKDDKKDDKKPKDDRKPAKDDKKPKDDPKEEVKKDDKKDDKKEEPKADDPEELEGKARKLLALAKMNLEAGKEDKARDRLEEVIKKYKGTKAAQEAQKLLDKIKDN
jgi:FimV-like protein